MANDHVFIVGGFVELKADLRLELVRYAIIVPNELAGMLAAITGIGPGLVVVKPLTNMIGVVSHVLPVSVL